MKDNVYIVHLELFSSLVYVQEDVRLIRSTLIEFVDVLMDIQEEVMIVYQLEISVNKINSIIMETVENVQVDLLSMIKEMDAIVEMD